MNAPRATERLQPCLIDRLLDHTRGLTNARARLESLEKSRKASQASNEADTEISEQRLLVRELEQRAARTGISEQELRAFVLRDLAALLGATSLDSAIDLDAYPQVASSVVNFGLRGLTGWSAGALAPRSIEQIVHEAIVRFEPRILDKQLQIKAELGAPETDERNTLTIEVSGYLWAQPLPRSLFLRSRLDLETGAVAIEERRPG